MIQLVFTLQAQLISVIILYSRAMNVVLQKLRMLYGVSQSLTF